jgi:hypothetical protein
LVTGACCRWMSPQSPIVHALLRMILSPASGLAVMKYLSLVAALAMSISVFSHAQEPVSAPTVPTPAQQVCAQLIADSASSGKPITDCFVDLEAQRLIIRGKGWTKLDLNSLCSGPVAALNTRGHFAIDLKQGNNDAGSHIDCNISNATR